MKRDTVSVKSPEAQQLLTKVLVAKIAVQLALIVAMLATFGASPKDVLLVVCLVAVWTLAEKALVRDAAD